MAKGPRPLRGHGTARTDRMRTATSTLPGAAEQGHTTEGIGLCCRTRNLKRIGSTTTARSKISHRLSTIEAQRLRCAAADRAISEMRPLFLAPDSTAEGLAERAQRARASAGERRASTGRPVTTVVALPRGSWSRNPAAAAVGAWPLMRWRGRSERERDSESLSRRLGGLV